MSDNAAPEGQHILDARLEYGQLFTTYLALANMFWVGYGAFFAVNTLLATALGFSYSETGRAINPEFLKIARILLSACGMVMCLIAIYAGASIARAQRLVHNRGKAIESVLKARTFSQFRSHHTPVATTIGRLLFFAMWAGALYTTLEDLFPYLKGLFRQAASP